MATRTSSRQIAAREQARERAAAYAARERELVELAEAFFVADGEASDIMEAAEVRIATIRQQAERDVAATRAKAAEVAERMLTTGAPAPQVADRLGMSVAELRRVRSALAKGGEPSSVDAGDVDDRDPGLSGRNEKCAAECGDQSANGLHADSTPPARTRWPVASASMASALCR